MRDADSIPTAARHTGPADGLTNAIARQPAGVTGAPTMAMTMTMPKSMPMPKPKAPTTPPKAPATTATPPPALDGWFTHGKHCYPIRVQYEDTDAGGVVYHANYLAYAERARSAALTCIGINQATLLGEGLAFVVAKLNIRYHQAARLGDLVHVTSYLANLGKASMQLKQIIGESAPAADRITQSDSTPPPPIATLDVTIVPVRLGKTTAITRMPHAIKKLLGESFFAPIPRENGV